MIKVEGPLHVVCKCDKCKTESQEPMAWKLMPKDATDAMLKAMDECSAFGYNERLYAGHAASVYMAAWDALNTHPPQRTWIGLTDDETEKLIHNFGSDPHTLLDEVDARLKARNT
jgi:hypothetical protein